MTVTTATGRELEADYLTFNPVPPRMYLHFPEYTMTEIATIVLNPAELPFDGHPDYTEVQAISNADGGVNLTLRIPD